MRKGSFVAAGSYLNNSLANASSHHFAPKNTFSKKVQKLLLAPKNEELGMQDSAVVKNLDHIGLVAEMIDELENL